MFLRSMAGSPAMKLATRSSRMLLALMLPLFGSGTFAQAPLNASQMPARTTFYLTWRGAPDAAIRKTNSLMALWDDPEFAPVRSAIAEGLLSGAGKKSSAQLTQQDFDEYALLLENPFVVGY